MQTKKTKIICTLSDFNCEVEFLKRLYESGMNVARINSAHATFEGAQKIVDNVRAVSNKIAILIDTKGPEVRLTQMEPAEGIHVKEGDWIEIYDGVDQICKGNVLYTNCKDFVNDVPMGAHVLIDDGAVDLFVTGKEMGGLLCEVQNAGIIKGKKSVNVPNVHISLPPLTEKDKKFIEWAVKNDIDFIAHSFVRCKEDLIEVQSYLDQFNSHIKIIAKIENQQGVDKIDEILDHCYGVMVARGDLGVEIETEKIPLIQKHIIERCRACRKPVIIATQMLHSMIENPRPTRAEVTDVSNAIFEKTDAVMLSGETATGKYPVEAVKYMSRIAKEAEVTTEGDYELDVHRLHRPIAGLLAYALVHSVEVLPLKAIISNAGTGRTARYLAESRPRVPIYAMCYYDWTMRELALTFDVYCYPLPYQKSKEEMVETCLKILKEDGKVKEGDLVGFIGGNLNIELGATYMEYKYV